MNEVAISGLPLVEERDAGDEVARIYAEVRRELQLPTVPNMMKALGASPAALSIHWGITRSFYAHTTLPQSVIAMIAYTIATKTDCAYCSVSNELTCRMLGIDEGTLNDLIENLDSVSPQRLRAIIGFALAVAIDPQRLTAEDYDAVRSHGIGDDELAEIILVAAAAKYFDTLADALKIEVDPETSEALERIGKA